LLLEFFTRAFLQLVKKYNINVARTVKEKVEEELVKTMRKERQEIFEKTADLLAGVTEEDIVRAVRKSRELR